MIQGWFTTRFVAKKPVLSCEIIRVAIFQTFLMTSRNLIFKIFYRNFHLIISNNCMNLVIIRSILGILWLFIILGLTIGFSDYVRQNFNKNLSEKAIGLIFS